MLMKKRTTSAREAMHSLLRAWQSWRREPARLSSPTCHAKGRAGGFYSEYCAIAAAAQRAAAARRHMADRQRCGRTGSAPPQRRPWQR